MSEYPEPSIKQMLADPIVRALMTADGVQADGLQALLCSVANRLQAGNCKATEESTRRRSALIGPESAAAANQRSP